MDRGQRYHAHWVCRPHILQPSSIVTSIVSRTYYKPETNTSWTSGGVASRESRAGRTSPTPLCQRMPSLTGGIARDTTQTGTHTCSHVLSHSHAATNLAYTTRTKELRALPRRGY